MQFMRGLTRRYSWMVLVLACVGCQSPPPATSAVTARSTRAAVKPLPDWSGVWQLTGGWDTNIAVADGGTADLTLEYKKIRMRAREEEHQSNLAKCLPAGPTAILQHSTLHEYLITPESVVMLFEDGDVRRIHTDGRAHRPLADLRDSYMGDSIGHWEGNTLVVDTIGFTNGELFENYGVRATLNTHLVERIHMNDAGELQIDAVLTDPVIFAKPYVYTRPYKRSSLPMEEPGCIQYSRDNGTSLDLTPPPED